MVSSKSDLRATKERNSARPLPRIFTRSIFSWCQAELIPDLAQPDLHPLAVQDKFVTAVRKQFPDDGTPAESPKRMRVGLRDHHNGYFEADVVVSDASTDENGKVSRYMVGTWGSPGGQI